VYANATGWPRRYEILFPDIWVRQGPGTTFPQAVVNGQPVTIPQGQIVEFDSINTGQRVTFKQGPLAGKSSDQWLHFPTGFVLDIQAREVPS
jgi:hypothetical protein